ncbi:MAG TPA: hypothetical protein H9747_14940 [Candidatus Blautia stercorigallinarum]|uniref:Uncharacterized protein n=1 Tax=Candidatus Blautia stercorigallinarum TaxID=2838501 RepID=A0A9D1PFH6_9FIRM|nr:hypothetical protein [Candidatus Blautia stercorigallinarum]
MYNKAGFPSISAEVKNSDASIWNVRIAGLLGVLPAEIKRKDRILII